MCKIEMQKEKTKRKEQEKLWNSNDREFLQIKVRQKIIDPIRWENNKKNKRKKPLGIPL